MSSPPTIDTGWIGDTAPQVEVRRHDVTRDEPRPAALTSCTPGSSCPICPPATRRCGAWRRPCGLLLIEGFDPGLQPAACVESYRPEHHVANKLYDGVRTLLAQRGFDPAYGRKLPRLFAEQGLVDVAADAYFPVALPAVGALNRANLDQVGAALVAQGLATEQELQGHYDALDRGLCLAQGPLISAWGRRPPQL